MKRDTDPLTLRDPIEMFSNAKVMTLIGWSWRYTEDMDRMVEGHIQDSERE